MALKLNISEKIGCGHVNNILGISDVDELYIKINRYSGEDNTCRFVLSYFEYLDGQIGNRLSFPERVYQFTTVEDGSDNDFNVRKQAYEFLKTLPEFEGCEDC